MRRLIGLGFRCDVAFQLRMHGAENIAHFFDWLATPAEGVIKIIEADFAVFAPDHLILKTDHSPHCVEDRFTGTVFHHQFPMFEGHVQPDFLLFYQNFIQKFRHLAARFRDYLQSQPVTLVRHFISHEQALRLEAAVFNLVPDADVRFLYILDHGEVFSTPHGHARVIKNDGSSLGDPAAWAELLAAEGLIGEPYRHATAEILGSAHDDHNLMTSNRFSEAQLQAAIVAHPQSLAFPLELSQWYAANGRLNEAEDMAISALARAPDHPEALFHATMTQWRRGRLSAPEAAATLATLVDSAAPPASWLAEAATAMREAGQAAHGLNYAERALRTDPMNRNGFLQKALCLLETGDFVAAEFAMDAAIRHGPISPINQHRHANILKGVGRLDAAIAVERSVLTVHPTFFPSLINLAGLLANQGLYDEALASYREALPVAGEHMAVVKARIDALNDLVPEPLAP